MKDVFLNKIIGQVSGYVRAIQVIRGVIPKGFAAGLPAQTISLGLPLSMLLMLATEVALKGIIYKEAGEKAPGIHEINKLFLKLNEESQRLVKKYFLEKHKTTEVDLNKMLSEYSRDFITKRYMYENDTETKINFTFYNRMLEITQEILMK